jgi:hypothetical protein
MANAKSSIAYIQADVPKSADPQLAQMADVFAQSVAVRFRRLLHAHGDTLPPGEPLITWRIIDQGTAVYVTVSSHAPPVYWLGAVRNDTVVKQLMLNAARAAGDSGEGAFWPSDARGDSLTFALSLSLSEPGKAELDNHGRIAFPIFSLLIPTTSPARQLDQFNPPQYPPDEQNYGATATVIMRFIVDTTGSVDTRSIQDVWNAKEPRPRGQMLAVYKDFLQSVTRWLATARFEPARVRGCPVRQVVQQPFVFSTRR